MKPSRSANRRRVEPGPSPYARTTIVVRALASAIIGAAACTGDGGTGDTEATGPGSASAPTSTTPTTTDDPSNTGAPTGSPTTMSTSAATVDTADATDTVDPSGDPSGDSSSGGIPGEPAISWVGRIDDSTPGQWRYQWPNTGFVVRFEGTGLRVTMDDRARYHTVVVDGVVTARMPTAQGEAEYVVAEGLAPGVHVVELYRQTESFAGPTLVTSIDIDGELLAPPPVARRIEIAGDSAAVGYGNLGRPCADSNESTNAYETFGAIAARHFDGHASIIAISGASISGNNRLPDSYDRVLQSEGTPWDFSVQADAVVVELGINDFISTNDPPGNVWIADYLEFVTHIREVHPSAFILMVSPFVITGGELAMIEGYLQQIVDARNDAGDDAIAWANIGFDGTGDGCANHPSVAQQGILGEALADELSLQLGW